MLRYLSNSVIITLTTLLFFGLMADVKAQQSDSEEEYRRFSISAHGGLTFENNDRGLRLFGSNFNRVTDHSYNIGGGIQYALTPFWSVGAEYRYTTIDGFDSFDTEIHSAGLKNYFNFNRMFRHHSISEYINPFITLGLGRDFFTYESSTENISNNELHVNGGVGLALNVTNSIEVFSQYELQFSSNSLDNIREGFPSDLIGMASGGIRLHLGSRDKQRLSLAPRRIHLNESEYNEYRSSGDRIAQLEQELRSSRDRISALESELEERKREYEQRISRMQSMLNEQEERVRNLKKAAEEMEVKAGDTLEVHDGLPDGHYIQLLATKHPDRAKEARRNANSLLGDIASQPENQVIVTLRRGFYEILVGPYSRFANAQEIHPNLLNEYHDAFIITFPRPAILRDEYIDIQIVN